MDRVQYVDIPCNTYRYKKGRTSSIKYIAVHYTAGDGDTAKGNCQYFNREADNKSSAHIFVDTGSTIYRSVKFCDTAYAVGANSYKHRYCRNSNSISIEMCSKKDSNGVYYIEEGTIQNCLKVIYDLMITYNIPFENVIRHYDVTGKLCPAPLVDENAWYSFKLKLKNYIALAEGVLSVTQYEELKQMIQELNNKVDKIHTERVYKWNVELPEYAVNSVQKALDKGVFKGVSPDNLYLPETLMRTIVMMDRAGLLD